MIEIRVKIQQRGREFSVLIKDKKVYYKDIAWAGPIQWFPQDPEAAKIIRESRNKIPMYVIDLLRLTPAEIAEYEVSKEDEVKLMGICIDDIRKKGYEILEVKKT